MRPRIVSHTVVASFMTHFIPNCEQKNARRIPTGAAYNLSDMGQPRVEVDQGELAEFCRRHHIRRLALFGSVLRQDFGPDSDIDVLVEFEPGHTPGLAFIRMERELSTLFQGRSVDLVTPRFLNHRIRDRVLAEAETQYAA